jgi:hypothetical protein
MKRRARVENTWIRLLAAFIAFISFYDGYGIKEFISEQAPVSTIFRRRGDMNRSI